MGKVDRQGRLSDVIVNHSHIIHLNLKIWTRLFQFFAQPFVGREGCWAGRNWH